MTFSALFFDLDDTLYPPKNGLWNAIRERMNDYMLERLKLPGDQVSKLRSQYYETYGTTLRGLQIHYQVDADEFLAYVHDLPVETIVQPDPALDALLDSLAYPKYIFTNADRSHALRVLGALGVAPRFEGIIDVCALDYQCKPNPAAYQIALHLAGQTNPLECVYLDDSARNLAPAYQMGFHTILVGGEAVNGIARHSIASIHDLPKSFPDLWN